MDLQPTYPAQTFNSSLALIDAYVSAPPLTALLSVCPSDILTTMSSLLHICVLCLTVALPESMDLTKT